ncbi:MAG: hypothetical protein HDT48_08435 [Ruminococcaceae bacterium]|nr:hypothetical protein [Oscillospiraceae bacterium]
MKVNVIKKTAASLLACTMLVCAAPLSVFAEASQSPLASAPPSGPSLGSGASSGGYEVNSSTIGEDGRFIIEAVTYIPIANFTEGLDAWDVTNGNNVFAFATSNESFTIGNTNAVITDPEIVGSFLSVTAMFIDVTYTGKGRSFTYSICYNSAGESITVPITVSISECVETNAAPDPSDPSAAKFALSSANTYIVNAGSSGTLTIELKNINNGTFSNVAASLASGDENVIVETVETQTSTASFPRFSFRVSAPASASSGIYNLTLTFSVFASNGAETSNGSFTIPVRIASDVVSSGLTVSAYDVSKSEVQDGDSFNLTLTLKNDCKIDLNNVKVSLDGLDSSKFVLDGGFSTKSVNIGKDRTVSVVFPLVACAGISNVRESIPVQVEYKINPDNDSSVQTFSTSVILQCKPKKDQNNDNEYGQYDISMTDYSFSSNSVETGTKFNLTFTLQNISEKDITGARVSVQELTGSKFAIDSGLTYKNFDMKAGESQSFTFPLIGCDGISSMREVIPVEITFGNVSSTVYTTVTCNPSEDKNPNNDNVFSPPIIIQNYDFGGEYVTGGTAFPLRLTIQNADSKTPIENLKVTINGGAGNGDSGVAFSPANSSNSFFIESLPGKATTDINIDLLPRADSKPDSYPVIVTFEYEYIANGKRAKGETVTETITIPLQQEDRFTLNPAQYAESVGLGEMVYISTSFVNKGKSGVYNVTADVEGDGFDKSQGTYYVGNVNSGSEEYYDVQITPNVEGTVKGDIVVTYEDANGTQKEQRLPFSINVISYSWDEPVWDDPGWDDPGMYDPGMEEGGFPLWAWFAIGGGVVVIAIIVIVIVVKHKKKKKELEDDDDVI